MKKLYTAFLLVLLAALLGVGIYSLADQDAAGSASESASLSGRNFPSARCWTGRISRRSRSIIPIPSPAARRC